MPRTSYRLTGNQKVYIIGLSDLHLGSNEFNEDYFEYALEIIDNIKQPKLIFLCGDLLESASKNIGNSAFKTNLTLDEQLDTIINYLKPFKKHIVCNLPGNHEARVSKDYDLSIHKIIAKALRCESPPQILYDFQINKKHFTIYARHGKGSAAHAHLAEGKIIRETQYISANLYMEGHNHRMSFFTQPILTEKGIERKYYAFNGAFLKYKGSYAENMYLPVLPEAFQTISINKDLILRNTPYMIDQMRPDLLEL